jgi:hypothetical protein
MNFPKTDLRYWEGKVAFQTPQARTYSIQIQHANRRAWINLHTANRAQAAVLARNFYEDLRANGWDAALARRKGTPEVKKVNATIGQYIEAVSAKSLIYPRTLTSYAQALRKIAGDIHSLPPREAGRLKLASLSPEKIEAWRIEYIRRGAINPLKEKSARISANSFILRSRALFNSQVVARVGEVLELPEPLPFAGVKAERIRPTRYRSSFNMGELLADAKAELAPFRPEEWKIFLLAAFAGLRRNEIDKLPWTAFRWDEGVIRIAATAHYRPKSHDSEADVQIDPELLEVFRAFHAAANGGEFVIESRTRQTGGQSYRCQDEIASLIGWLRTKGVVSRTPLHTLRKEFGSWINAHFGLTATQQMLRHASIETTAAHYVENKKRPALGFSHLSA